MSPDRFSRSVIDGYDLTFWEGVQYVYHCHHYNLFHDQTIDDALGDELGLEVRTRAAQHAFEHLLRALTAAGGEATDSERLQLAQAVFPWMGHGRLTFQLNAEGGSAEGEFLHYGFAWKEKYGGKVRRFSPADAVAAGYAGAATAVALGDGSGRFEAVEEDCIAMRDPRCLFRIHAAEARDIDGVVGLSEARPHMGEAFGGLNEEKVSKIASGLQQFVRGVGGDRRGLVQAFGVYVTMHLTSYYNETAYEMIRIVEQKTPDRTPMAEALLREAGQVCAFNTFGNILLSPEWEGMVGELTNDVEELVSSSCAIARGLGFGRWSLAELEPGRRLVMRAPCDYESPFFLARYGTSPKPRCYFLQGAALATMLLAHAVDWESKPELTQAFYVDLFRSGKLPWEVEQTRCPTRGDEFAEVIVNRVA